MTNALISVDNHCFAADHAQDIALRADQGAGSAADTVGIVNVRVLGLRTIRAQLALFRGLASLRRSLFFLVQIVEQECSDDGGSDQK